MDGEGTIFALASGRGRAGVAVLRLSGPAVLPALRSLAGRDGFTDRRATLALLKDPATGEPIDQALLLWFPAPHSFTGEDAGELHLHGGPAVLARAAAALGRLGLRQALPGEFSRRAFAAGKLDLVQAEAIADLVAAETEGQRRLALRQLDGALGRLYGDWGRRLTEATAQLEALIDFPDEGLDEAVEGRVRDSVAALTREMEAQLVAGEKTRRLHDGVEVAIVGAPNVGKSSLLNRLAGADHAIVSDQAGTTRDAIEVRLDLDGVPVVLVDTAGLRETADPVEREGVRRARARAERADIVLRMVLPGDPVPAVGPDDLLVVNKVDLGPATAGIAVSALTGAGIDGLLRHLSERAAAAASVGEVPSFTRERHAAAVREAHAALVRSAAPGLAPELAAEDLRQALRALGRIVGRVDVEDLLDVIFSSFCIGK